MRSCVSACVPAHWLTAADQTMKSWEMVQRVSDFSFPDMRGSTSVNNLQTLNEEWQETATQRNTSSSNSGQKKKKKHKKKGRR